MKVHVTITQAELLKLFPNIGVHQSALWNRTAKLLSPVGARPVTTLTWANVVKKLCEVDPKKPLSVARFELPDGEAVYFKMQHADGPFGIRLTDPA